MTDVESLRTSPATAPPQAATRPPTVHKTPPRRKLKNTLGKWHYAVLTVAVAISIFPLYWMFVVASNTNADVSRFPPKVIPGPNFLLNVTNAVTTVPFWNTMLNSFIVAAVTTVSAVFFGTLAGFAFAKLQFRGRNGLMLFIIATMMIPLHQLGLIPLYMLMSNFGWVGELRAVIVPALVTALGVFWMRQVVAASVSDELLEAGRVDGCSMFGLFRHVVVPSVRSGAAVLGLFTFLFQWNDFLWPLVVLGGNQSNHTVQIALRTLNQQYYQDYAMIMAGTLMSVIPLLVVFVFFSKQMIAGVMEGAVKG